MKALIVDDAMFMRRVIIDTLKEFNVEAIEAANGKEAINKYQEHNPDIVTLDITMPDMDGMTALKEIMKIDPNAKVIMCSAMGQKDFVIECVNNGAKNFIVKPFQKEKIKEVVLNVIG